MQSTNNKPCIAPLYLERISQLNINNSGKKYLEKIGQAYSIQFSNLHSSGFQFPFRSERVSTENQSGFLYVRHIKLFVPQLWAAYIGSPLFLRNNISHYYDKIEPPNVVLLPYSVIDDTDVDNPEQFDKITDELSILYQNENPLLQRYENGVLNLARSYNLVVSSVILPQPLFDEDLR